MESTERGWIDEVTALERRLLDPAVRSDPRAVARFLHPEFREVGASGRLWDRATMIDNLASATGSTAPIRDEEMAGTVLTGRVVLLTYLSDADGRRARRSSVWRHDEESGWRLLFHQGTPTG